MFFFRIKNVDAHDRFWVQGLLCRLKDMAKVGRKLKIFSIVHEGAASQSLGIIDFKDNENYVGTRVR